MNPIRSSVILLALALGSCQTQSPAPALQAAELTKQAFEASLASHERLVRRSAPTDAMLENYLRAANQDRAAFQQAHSLLLQAISSLHSVTPEQVTQATNAVIEVIRAAR
jgi:hypothetical protein